jgi:glucosamine--fructose-6-phosphate aminotransferase (isomerizing)
VGRIDGTFNNRFRKEVPFNGLGVRDMFKQIRRFSLSIWNGLKKWRLFIGCRPDCLPPNSIIFFPIIPEKMCCGLAGILSIKREGVINEHDLITPLSECLKRIEKYELKKIFNKMISSEEYLGGVETLGQIEKIIFDLKQDANLEPLFFQADIRRKLNQLSNVMNSFLSKEESLIEENADILSTGEMEHINGCLIQLKDAAWALDKDILSNFENIIYLSGSEKKSDRCDLSPEGFNKYRKINFLLNSIDRIEVRGRDSAGIQISFALNDGHLPDQVERRLKNQGLYDTFIKRLVTAELLDGSVHLSDKTSGGASAFVSFTYKKASVTGKLGENTRYIRDKIRSDQILRAFIDESIDSEMYLAHTRWASVGSITIENCHPVNNSTLRRESGQSPEIILRLKEYPFYGMGNWSIDVALNGDIDNYLSLRSAMEVEGKKTIDSSVTTDTKIIPLQIERYLCQGNDLENAFRMALNDFKGSHAIVMQSNLEPGKVFLALKGSGQSLYIGLRDDQYIYSSEIYGLVELTPYFIKMDGEKERIPGDSRTKGQIFVLNHTAKDRLDGIRGFSYDGQPLKIDEKNIQKAEITTRDIDRKHYPHYLLKEILEAPLSVKKTLRGKYRITDGLNGLPVPTFNLGTDIMPSRLEKALLSKDIRNIFVIGQGTAAVAGAAIADAFSKYLKGLQIKIQALKASELSGFFLEETQNHTLVIAVTQSGTTTDTNRAVAMAKKRGAHLIAIVNRRQSDITHLVDGIFYTSDGRDIEMSVASTKAFYSQIVAGYVLALYFARIFDTLPDALIVETLKNLESTPEMMNKVIAAREKMKRSAWYNVKKKKYWAVVGSGPNKVAADEIRIKLSELCYKTISSDIVEDKKHIDLSSEPLILVCAAGNPKFVVEDIVKDVAIFKSHAATAVVIADEGEDGFGNIADSVIALPSAPFPTSVILNTLAGHLWGYYAACSINQESEFLREFRSRLSLKINEQNLYNFSLFEKIADPSLHKLIENFSSEFSHRRNSGFFSSMSVELASDVTLLLKYAIGKLPLEDFWEDFKEKRISSSPLDFLDISLGRAVDELSRPIDAIRHQAKTVTVGTSRKEEMLQGILFELLSELNFSLENLTSRDGISAKRVQNAISGIKGYTLYDIDGLNEDGKPGDASTISIAKKGGISLSMKSRVEKPGPLKGTKKTIVGTGDMYAGLGKVDKASIVIIPLLGEGSRIKNLLLAHVDFNNNLSVKEKKEILGDKLDKIVDLVNEYNLPWDNDYIKDLPIEFLLGEGVGMITSRITKSLEGTQYNKI